MVKNLLDELEIYDELDDNLADLVDEKEADDDLVDMLKPFLKKLNKVDRTIEKRVDEQVEYKVDKIDAKITNKVLTLSQQIQDRLDSIKDGKDYVLTESDKKEIAKSIKVPVVEKIIEKREKVIEKPIVTNEIKEVAIAETAEQIVEKINTLPTDKDEYKIDVKHIKGIDQKGKTTYIWVKHAVNWVPEGWTIGQKLVKKSPLDYDTQWVDDNWWGWSGTVETIVAWPWITVDSTDPANPIVSVEVTADMQKAVYDTQNRQQDIFQYARRMALIF